MKPIFGALQAWTCIVISVFAIVILSIIASMFARNHPELTGSVDDPEDGPAVAATLWASVFVYVGFLVFCGFQAVLNKREARRGAIVLS